MINNVFTTSDMALFLKEIKIGILVLNSEKRVAYANDWFLSAAGITKKEAFETPLGEIFPEPKIHRLSMAVNEAIDARRATLLTTKLNKFLFPLQTPNGTKMEQRVTVQPFGEDSQSPRCIIQIEDITDIYEREKILKQKRKEVEADRAYLNAVLQYTAEGIITIDDQGAVETFNVAAEHMFGYSAEEMIGQNISYLIPENERELHQQYINDSELQASRIINQARELFGCRKDKSVFPIELNVSRMRIAGRTLFIGILRDITEQKEIDRMKSEFVSTVSHELRTPLTSIKGSLGLVAHGNFGALPDEALTLINIARRNSERLVNLVNDILDVEKLESGTQEFHFQLLDLSKLVADTIENNTGFANEYGVSYVPTNLTSTVTVLGDPDRLIQAIANLLSNAAKFSPKGQEVGISITCADGKAKVSISDHGPGISKEFSEHIFGRFAQADASDAREKGGTGLGLNITKSIIEKHKGTIDFKSEVGVGSTFFFILPLSK